MGAMDERLEIIEKIMSQLETMMNEREVRTKYERIVQQILNTTLITREE